MKSVRSIVRLWPALLFVPLAACKPQAAPPAAGMGGMPPPEVVAVKVAPHAMPLEITAPGRLQAVRTAVVSARVEGILEQRLYREGSEVKAGALLFRIDDRMLAANLASAGAALAKAKAQALIARQNLERLRALVDSKAISKQEFDQAVAADAQAQAEVKSAEAAEARAAIDLSYAKVTAPISGRIGRALVSEGALVGKGEATPLASIEQYDPIWVDFSQSSSEFLNLRAALGKRADAPVRLVLENGQVYPRAGKLLFSDLVVDPATGSVGMRAEFPNPDRALLPGQFVTVRLPLTQAGQVITVPQRAVQVSPQGQAVMLVGPDGMVKPQPVKTAGLVGGDWIIGEGLKGGENVIVDGVQKARPGMPVKMVSGAPQPPATRH